jgi:sulfofructose kinase
VSSVQAVDAMVAGLNIVDVLVRLPQNVQRGEKHEAQDLLIQGGAPAGNAACLIASLGWRTGFIARMGSDAMSCIARSELMRHGVLEDFFIHDESSTPGVSVVEIEPSSGERTVLYSLKGYRSLKREDVPVSEVKRAKLILVDGYETEAAQTMLEAIHGTECHSVLDIEAGDRPTLRRLIELGTHVILPLTAAQKLSGKLLTAEALRELSTWTTGQVIATDGVNGSWAYTREGIHHQPAFKVEALDTTG